MAGVVMCNARCGKCVVPDEVVSNGSCGNQV